MIRVVYQELDPNDFLLDKFQNLLELSLSVSTNNRILFSAGTMSYQTSRPTLKRERKQNKWMEQDMRHAN